MNRTKTKQTMLLDKNGLIVRSCDSLFASHSLQKEPVTQYVAFIDSIFSMLLDMPVENFPMCFPRVEINAEFLSGIYDFQFEKVVLNKQEYIRCTIVNNTRKYELLRQKQQLHHEQYLFKKNGMAVS